MSSRDPDSSSRLTSALDEIFGDDGPRLPADDRAHDQSAPTSDSPASRPAGAAPTSDQPTPPNPSSVDTAPYVLPDIVPATADWSVDDDAPAESRDTPATDAPTERAPVAPSAPTAPTPVAAPATGWTDHMPTVTAPPGGGQLRAPGRRPRVRKVTRVLRHIDPWSTFKVAAIFSAVLYVVLLTAGVLLWRVADNTGTLDNVERWFTQFGWETFEFDGGAIFSDAWVIGLFGAVALTGGVVLLATLFNLVSDIIGGVRMTILEEEVVERTLSSSRRYVVRRPAGSASDAAWDVDGDDEARQTEPTSGAATADASGWSVDDDEASPTESSPDS